MSNDTPRASEIARLWREAVHRVIDSQPRVSVLFSGGLDSSLVAHSAGKLADVELVSVGVAGSHDLSAAEAGARILGLPCQRRSIEQRDVERILDIDGAELGRVRPVSRSVLIGIALAVETASNRLVLCGQGADELFLGYSHFQGRSASEVDACRGADLEGLLHEDWPAAKSVSQRRGKTLESPFLDPELVSYLRRIPIGVLTAGGERKPLLRRVARALGLPEQLAAREKKAFQYGSGIERLTRASRLAGAAGPSPGDDPGTGFVPDGPS